MNIKLRKQPEKYLRQVDANTRAKLYKALDRLATMHGDIKPLQGQPNRYRYKIAHYRIVFDLDRHNQIITVVEINTRTNIKYS